MPETQHRDATGLDLPAAPAPGIEVSIRMVLSGFELDVEFSADARRVGLTGPSGGGKTLTLQSIAGVQAPQGGRIMFGGELFFDAGEGFWLDPRRRGVGYVPQHHVLFPHLTVQQNVGFGLHQWTPEHREERVEELLETFRLTGLEKKKPRQLSGGQRQRVALARALAPRPRLLILDEPFAALDAELHQETRSMFAQASDLRDLPLIIVSHDPSDLRSMTHKVFTIDSGRVVAEDSL